MLLAAAASTVTDLHIFAFGAILPEIEREFLLSEVERGLLAGLALLTIAVLRFPAGMIVDRLGARQALSIGLIGIGVGELVAGFSHDVSMLAVGQVLSGYGMAQSVVSGQPLIGRGLPSRLHGQGMGVFNFGFGFGAFLGFLLTPALIGLTSWRLALRILGAAVVMIGLISASLSIDEGGPTRANPRLGKTVFQDARVWLLAFHMAAVFGVFVATATWITSLTEASAALWMAAAFPFGYMVGSLAAGRLIGRLAPSGLVWAGPLLAAAPIAMIPWLGLGSVVVGSMVGGALMGVALAARDTKVAEFWAKGGMGLAYGTITAIGALGAFVGPVVAGYVLESTGSFSAAFGVLGLVLLLAAPIGYRAVRTAPLV